jgi:tRNA-specific 2-thiouridylase
MVNNNKNKTVVVAMSGGVDSSVAAALLKDEGYNLIGVTMKTWGFDDFPEKDSGCCSLETIYNAKNVSEQLGFHHYTLDFTERFNETVITNFIDEYMKGNTPNPCVLCNKVIKWGALLEKAESLGADFIATGHYAKLKHDEKTNRYYITVSGDEHKDQTYALWRLSQFALSKTLFPLGNYKKPEIREIAKKLNLKSAETPDSQEICFVPNDDYRELLKIRIPDVMNKLKNGDIIYKEKPIGKHRGFAYYTIGQRKGLNVSLGKPVYVTKIDAEKNLVFIDDEEYLYHPGFIAKDINLMLMDKLDKPIKAKVKIRYKDEGSNATLEQIDNDKIKALFDKPKKSITPGQSAVFYIGDDVLGGGIIDEVIT